MVWLLYNLRWWSESQAPTSQVVESCTADVGKSLKYSWTLDFVHFWAWLWFVDYFSHADLRVYISLGIRFWNQWCSSDFWWSQNVFLGCKLLLLFYGIPTEICCFDICLPPKIYWFYLTLNDRKGMFSWFHATALRKQVPDRPSWICSLAARGLHRWFWSRYAYNEPIGLHKWMNSKQAMTSRW